MPDIRSYFNAARSLPFASNAADISPPPTPASSVPSHIAALPSPPFGLPTSNFPTSSLTSAERPLAIKNAGENPQAGVSSRHELAQSFSPSCPSCTPTPSSFFALPLPILFPLLNSLLFNVSDELLLPLLAFNFAVWQFRKPAQASRLEEDSQWLVNRILDLASQNLASVKPKLKKRKKPVDIESESRVHNCLVNGMDDSTAFCYTDGSASPNPGPCGAGVAIFLKNPDLLYDFGVSLGRGTNNVAEIYGLGVVLTELQNIIVRHPSIKKAVIFCDSKLALRVAASHKLPRTNIELSKALRLTFLATSRILPIDLQWIRGHVSFGGNERVDRTSKAFASTELNNTFVAFNGFFTAQSRCTSWFPSYPLTDLPLHCFLANPFVPIGGRSSFRVQDGDVKVPHVNIVGSSTSVSVLSANSFVVRRGAASELSLNISSVDCASCVSPREFSNTPARKISSLPTVGLRRSARLFSHSSTLINSIALTERTLRRARLHSNTDISNNCLGEFKQFPPSSQCSAGSAFVCSQDFVAPASDCSSISDNSKFFHERTLERARPQVKGFSLNVEDSEHKQTRTRTGLSGHVELDGLCTTSNGKLAPATVQSSMPTKTSSNNNSRLMYIFLETTGRLG